MITYQHLKIIHPPFHPPFNPPFNPPFEKVEPNPFHFWKRWSQTPSTFGKGGLKGGLKGGFIYSSKKYHMYCINKHNSFAYYHNEYK